MSTTSPPYNPTLYGKTQVTHPNRISEPHTTLTDPSGQSINSVAFAPDGKMLASGDFKGHIYLWNPTTGARVATFTAPSASLITSVTFTSDSKTLPAADYDGHVYLWQIMY